MMVLLNLIFLLILFGLAVGVCWLVWSVLALIFAKRKLRVILLGIPASILVVVSGIVVMWYVLSRPHAVFEQQFGFPLPGDSTAINASSYMLGDSGEVFVHFRTTRPTLDRILAKGYQLDPGTLAISHDSFPAWYRPASGTTVERYVLEYGYSDVPTTQPQRTLFAAERRTLVFDPGTGEAWYWFQGID